MDEIRIAVRYEGQWITKDEKFIYESGKTKGILLPKNSSYNELYETVCRALDINPSEVSMEMKFLYNACHAMPPIEVLNDSDVKFFFSEVSDLSTRTALCITCSAANKIRVESVESWNPTLVDTAVPNGDASQNPTWKETTTPNGDAIELDNFPKGIFDHDCPKAAHVSTMKASSNEASPIDGVQCTNETQFKSKSDPPESSCARKSLNGSMTDGTSIDILFNSVKDVGVGDFFSNKEELHLKMKLLAVSRNFRTRVCKSTKDLLVLTCSEKNCKWRLRATKLEESEAFRVRVYHPTHTCSLDLLHFNHPQATSKLIGHCVKSKYEGTSQCYRPNDIIQDMKKRYGMTLSYNKAWRAREIGMALARGSSEHSFHILPLYCRLLEIKNPGTVTDIATDERHCFKSFFMALGASIVGFRSSIRPVIAIDGTFLKCKHQGMLFIATCLDGNNQVYPLAFGIGDSDNDNAWIWFMTKLRGCIGEIDDLVFISDRNTSIATAIKHTFPSAMHGICVYHLGKSMKASYKGVDVHDLFYKTAKAYQVSAFNHLMSQIRGVSAEVAQYLVEAEPKLWARCHFDGRRYSIMTTNIAECLNDVLREAQELPITKLIDYIRGLLQRWFWERREAASKISTPMTEWVETKLRQRMKKAAAYRVHPINLVEYHVIDGYLNPVVNLQDRTCECKKFQLDQLPCTHALATCNSHHISCYDYCSPFYRNSTLVAAYIGSIYPVGPKAEWIVPKDDEVPIVLPPKRRKPRGRSPKKRKLSRGEDKLQRKCGRCGGSGHNRQKCKE